MTSIIGSGRRLESAESDAPSVSEKAKLKKRRVIRWMSQVQHFLSCEARFVIMGPKRLSFALSWYVLEWIRFRLNFVAPTVLLVEVLDFGPTPTQSRRAAGLNSTVKWLKAEGRGGQQSRSRSSMPPGWAGVNGRRREVVQWDRAWASSLIGRLGAAPRSSAAARQRNGQGTLEGAEGRLGQRRGQHKAPAIG